MCAIFPLIERLQHPSEFHLAVHALMLAIVACHGNPLSVPSSSDDEYVFELPDQIDLLLQVWCPAMRDAHIASRFWNDLKEGRARRFVHVLRPFFNLAHLFLFAASVGAFITELICRAPWHAGACFKFLCDTVYDCESACSVFHRLVGQLSCFSMSCSSNAARMAQLEESWFIDEDMTGLEVPLKLFHVSSRRIFGDEEKCLFTFYFIQDREVPSQEFARTQQAMSQLDLLNMGINLLSRILTAGSSDMSRSWTLHESASQSAEQFVRLLRVLLDASCFVPHMCRFYRVFYLLTLLIADAFSELLAELDSAVGRTMNGRTLCDLLLDLLMAAPTISRCSKPPPASFYAECINCLKAIAGLFSLFSAIHRLQT